MKISKIATLALTVVTLTQANNVLAQGSVNAKIGSLGAGLEYVHPIGAKFAIGLGVNGLSFDESLNESDVDYSGDLNMNTISLLGDFHPMGTGFRITAGVMKNDSKFDLVGTPAGNDTVDLNGTTYTAAEIGSLNASIGFDSMAPYLGIGWGKAPSSGKGWGFDADLGVLFQGDPDTSLSVECGAGLSTLACAALQVSAAAEEFSLQNDSKEFDMYPVLSVGVSYKF